MGIFLPTVVPRPFSHFFEPSGMWVNSTGSIDKNPHPKSKTLNSSPASVFVSAWLVAEPTHLKNILVKLDHLLSFGEHLKKVKPPPSYLRGIIYFAKWYTWENLEALQVISPGRGEQKLLYFEWSPPWHVGWRLSGEGCHLAPEVKQSGNEFKTVCDANLLKNYALFQHQDLRLVWDSSINSSWQSSIFTSRL